MGGDLIICRCEEIALGTINRALEEGADTVHAVRAATRAGMGFCQGRTCRSLLAALLNAAGHDPVGNRPVAFRMPVRPVPLTALAKLGGEGSP